MKSTRRTFLKKSALLPAAVMVGANLITTELVSASGGSGGTSWTTCNRLPPSAVGAACTYQWVDVGAQHFKALLCNVMCDGNAAVARCTEDGNESILRCPW